MMMVMDVEVMAVEIDPGASPNLTWTILAIMSI